MELSITTKRLDEISKEERKRLNYLTLKKYSLLRDDVLQADEDLERFQLFLAWFDSKIVGWCAVFPSELSTDVYDTMDNHYLYTYVQYAHRRKGIGRALVDRASHWAEEQGIKVEVFAWNELSDKFYRNCNSPIEIMVEYV